MKLNKKRIDARIPTWLYDQLMEMAWKRGWNFTEMLEQAATKGLLWFQKNWEKMYPSKKKENPGENPGPGSVSNEPHENDTSEEVTDQEVDEALKDLLKDD